MEDYKEIKEEILPCPLCNEAWLYVSDGDYYSGYEAYGFKVKCQCGNAWSKTDWCKTREEAINLWNKRRDDTMTNEEAVKKLKDAIARAEYIDESYVDSIDLEAIKIALKALEIQMPKRPVEMQDWFTGKCPVCARRRYRYDNYCSGCGQKLYWVWVD